MFAVVRVHGRNGRRFFVQLNDMRLVQPFENLTEIQISSRYNKTLRKRRKRRVLSSTLSVSQDARTFNCGLDVPEPKSTTTNLLSLSPWTSVNVTQLLYVCKLIGGIMSTSIHVDCLQNNNIAPKTLTSCASIHYF